MDLRLIFGAGMVKILRVFRSHLDEKLNFREICRFAALTQPSVVIHLKKLTELDIVSSERFKNLVLYYFNKNQLSSLILSILDQEHLQNMKDSAFIKEFLAHVKADIVLLKKDSLILIYNNAIIDNQYLLGSKIDKKIIQITKDEVNSEIKKGSIAVRNGEAFYQLSD